MSIEGFKRKLTAILSADVKGYSRLMGEDEAATVRTIMVYREVMATLIHHHRGRVVDSPGDNVLAEFPSVVDAVQCAVEIQQVLKARNAQLPENRRMEFRIGINLGDVIEAGGRYRGGGAGAWGKVCVGGQCPQGERQGSHHGSVGGCDHGWPSVGRKVRPGPGGHLCRARRRRGKDRCGSGSDVDGG